VPSEDEREHSNGDGNVRASYDVNSSHPIDENATFATPLNENISTSKGQHYDSTGLRSSAEAEYRCLASTTCEVLWIVNLLKDLGAEGMLPVSLYYDSTSAIQIAANPVFHEKTKHFEIDVHLVREKVASGAIITVKIDPARNVADVFTKGLSISQHKQFCLQLNLVDMFEGLKEKIKDSIAVYKLKLWEF
ncbi:ribonuclease H-like domain-containing protein, partial [Tanacetum coccineum]